MLLPKESWFPLLYSICTWRLGFPSPMHMSFAYNRFSPFRTSCLCLLGCFWDLSIIRCDDSILSQSTSFEAGNPAFLGVASQSGVSQHGSSKRSNCPVAWEFLVCSVLLTLYELCALGIFWSWLCLDVLPQCYKLALCV